MVSALECPLLIAALAAVRDTSVKRDATAQAHRVHPVHGNLFLTQWKRLAFALYPNYNYDPVLIFIPSGAPLSGRGWPEFNQGDKSDQYEDHQHDGLRDRERWLGLRRSQRLEGCNFHEALRDQNKDI